MLKGILIIIGIIAVIIRVTQITVFPCKNKEELTEGTGSRLLWDHGKPVHLWAHSSGFAHAYSGGWWWFAYRRLPYRAFYPHAAVICGNDQRERLIGYFFSARCGGECSSQLAVMLL